MMMKKNRQKPTRSYHGFEQRTKREGTQNLEMGTSLPDILLGDES